MRALIKNPEDEGFRTIVVPNDLHVLQQLVGGPIETFTFATDCCIICNEEGKIQNLPFNCVYCGIIFTGTILLVGIDEDKFCDCPMSVTLANGGIEA
jgi:hypothetical protein